MRRRRSGRRQRISRCHGPGGPNPRRARSCYPRSSSHGSCCSSRRAHGSCCSSRSTSPRRADSSCSSCRAHCSATATCCSSRSTSPRRTSSSCTRRRTRSSSCTRRAGSSRPRHRARSTRDSTATHPRRRAAATCPRRTTTTTTSRARRRAGHCRRRGREQLRRGSRAPRRMRLARRPRHRPHRRRRRDVIVCAELVLEVIVVVGDRARDRGRGAGVHAISARARAPPERALQQALLDPRLDRLCGRHGLVDQPQARRPIAAHQRARLRLVGELEHGRLGRHLGRHITPAVRVVDRTRGGDRPGPGRHRSRSRILDQRRRGDLDERHRPSGIPPHRAARLRAVIEIDQQLLEVQPRDRLQALEVADVGRVDHLEQRALAVEQPQDPVVVVGDVAEPRRRARSRRPRSDACSGGSCSSRRDHSSSRRMPSISRPCELIAITSRRRTVRNTTSNSPSFHVSRRYTASSPWSVPASASITRAVAEVDRRLPAAIADELDDARLAADLDRLDHVDDRHVRDAARRTACARRCAPRTACRCRFCSRMLIRVTISLM